MENQVKPKKTRATIIGLSVALGAAAITAIVAPIAVAATNKKSGGDTPTPTPTPTAKYSVTINTSAKFTYDKTKIGTDKATAGTVYEIDLTPAENFKISKETITIAIAGMSYTGFGYSKDRITIPAADVVGNIDINVNPVLISIYNIDSDNILRGWANGVTEQDIKDACQGVMLIPKNVMAIADNAFFDPVNNKTLIPSSIKVLCFEEDVVYDKDLEDMTGYCNLHQAGSVAGFGYQSFAKSPFKYIKLPLGWGYEIQKNAFAGSNVEILQMPKYDFCLTEEEADLEHEDNWVGHMKGAYAHTHNKAPHYWKGHIAKFITGCFVDCEKLQTLDMTLWTEYESGDGIFSINGGKSNITTIDMCSYYYFTKYSGADTSSEYENWRKQIIEDHNSGKWQFQQVMPAGDFNLDTYTTDLKTLNVLFPDPWDKVGNVNDQIGQINMVRNAWGLSPIGADPWNRVGNLMFVPSHDNVFKGEPNKASAAIDEFALKSTEIGLKVSSTELERQQDLTQTKDYFIKGDIDFVITDANWTKGTPVNLSLRQITRVERLEAEYLGTSFTVCWETGKAPKAGDVVELTFTAVATHMLRYTPNLKLKITFAD